MLILRAHDEDKNIRKYSDPPFGTAEGVVQCSHVLDPPPHMRRLA